jgi:hypothetical protein
LKQLELDHVFKIKQLELEKQERERKSEIEKQELEIKKMKMLEKQVEFSQKFTNFKNHFEFCWLCKK